MFFFQQLWRKIISLWQAAVMQSLKKVDDVQAVHTAVRAPTAADVHTALVVAAAEYVLPIHHLLGMRPHVQLAGTELNLRLKIL